jgi:LacI family transcriptional regulator
MSWPNVNLKVLAEQAGVSRMTVSRALRGQPGVNAASRERIQQLAKKLGYRQDATVSRVMASLRHGKPLAGDVIAFIWPDAEREQTRRLPLLKQFRQGVKRRADELGYGIDEFWIPERGMGWRRLNRALTARGIRGVVLGPLLKVNHGRCALDWEKFATAVIGEALWKPRIDRVRHHHFLAMLIMLRELRRLGFKRPGFAVTRATDEKVKRLWSASFLAHRDRRHSDPGWAYLPERWNPEAFASWLDERQPDVLITSRIDRESAEAGVREAGLNAPVVLIALTAPDEGPAGIFHRHDEIGALAVNLVVDRLERNQLGVPAFASTALVEGQWVPGPLGTRLPHGKDPATNEKILGSI